MILPSAVEFDATAPDLVPLIKISKLLLPSLDTATEFQEPSFMECVRDNIGSLFLSPERNTRFAPSMLKSTEPALVGYEKID